MRGSASILDYCGKLFVKFNKNSVLTQRGRDRLSAKVGLLSGGQRQRVCQR